jgi:hypothetical protein
MAKKVVCVTLSADSRSTDRAATDRVDTIVESKWTEVAKKRLQGLRSGKVKPVPGDEVFSEVLKRFGG